MQNETTNFTNSKTGNRSQAAINTTQPLSKVTGCITYVQLQDEITGAKISGEPQNEIGESRVSMSTQLENTGVYNMQSLGAIGDSRTSIHSQNKISNSATSTQLQNAITGATEGTEPQSGITDESSSQVQNSGKNGIIQSKACVMLDTKGIALRDIEYQKEYLVASSSIQRQNEVIGSTKSMQLEKETEGAVAMLKLQNKMTHPPPSIQSLLARFRSRPPRQRKITIDETFLKHHKKCKLSISKAPSQSLSDNTGSRTTEEPQSAISYRVGEENYPGKLMSQIYNLPCTNYNDFVTGISDKEDNHSTSSSLLDCEEDEENSGKENLKWEISDPESVIEALSKCNDFSSSLENLSNYVHLEGVYIRNLAEKNLHIFSFREDELQLKRNLKVCNEHHSSHGCDNKDSCRTLHICNEFVNDNCQNHHCIFGHRWNTNHNLNILKELSLENISPNILQKIVETCAPSLLPDYFDYICQNYNSDECSKIDCALLHICHSFFCHLIVNSERKCADTCPLNHGMLSYSCTPILVRNKVSINETPRDIALAVASKMLSTSSEAKTKDLGESAIGNAEFTKNNRTVWSTSLYGDVAIKDICYYSVEGLCPMEESGCQRLHASWHFHWQINENGTHWLNLRPKQVKHIEISYCNPWEDYTELPPLDACTSDPSQKSLFLLMGRNIWSANFLSMTLKNLQANKELLLRRLCTEFIEGKYIKPSTFILYFLDSNNAWVPCRNTDAIGSTGLTRISSADIEQVYKLDSKAHMMFSTPSSTFLLDFNKMLQINQQTGESCPVKRRPESHLQEEEITDLPQHWNLSTLSVSRVTLNECSPEYQNIIEFFNHTGLSLFQVNKIERIQNVYLWKGYQNKVKEMTNLYGSFLKVDERYLFHGTTSENVDKICNENIDWRLYGSNVGHRLGQGTYFSVSPQFSTRYTKPDASGQCYMFVALVAVWTMAPGGALMKKPPWNPETNMRFDSTTDCTKHPSTFVKYDKQEYYPQYLVVFKDKFQGLRHRISALRLLKSRAQNIHGGAYTS